MNKKVITLCAAALLFGAGVNSAYADPVKTAVEYAKANKDLTLSEGVKFYAGAAAGQLFSVKKVTNKNDKKLYQTSVDEELVGVDKAAVFEVRNLKTVSGGFEFDLYVDGIQFAVSPDNKVEAIKEDTPAEKIITRFAVNKAKLSDIKLIYAANVGVKAEVGVTLFTAQGTYDVNELKDFNSKGTTFSFETKKNLVGNPFNELTPIQVEKNVIFVKGDAKDVEAFAGKQDEANAKKVQVLALSNPEKDYYQISGRKSYEGLKFRWMKGENYFKEDSASLAQFTSIKELDLLNGTQEMELTLKPKLTTVESGIVSEVVVKALSATPSDPNAYVTTVLPASIEEAKYKALVNPTLGANTYLDASVLLKDTKNVVAIYFTSSTKSKDGVPTSQTEYHKYLVAEYNDVYSKKIATVDAYDYVDFTSPAAQWVVSGFDGKYTFTLTNRMFKDQTLVLKLQPNGKEGGYQIVSAKGTVAEITKVGNVSVASKVELDKTSVKFKSLATTEHDGFLQFTDNQKKNGVKMTISGKDNVYAEQTFYVNYDEKDGYSTDIKGKKAQVFYPEASAYTCDNIVPAAYLKDGKIVISADTLKVPAYLFNTKITKVNKDLYFSRNTAGLANAEKAEAFRLAGLKEADGGYVLFALGREVEKKDNQYNEFDELLDRAIAHVTVTDKATLDVSGKAQEVLQEAKYYVTNFIDVVKTSNSLEAKTRYASLDNVLGSITYQLNKNKVNEGILKDTAIFRLSVVDPEAIEKGELAQFYISKYVGHGDSVRMFMYNAEELTKTFNEGTAQEVTDAKYILEGTENDPKVIFQPASLIAADKLVAGTDTLSGKAANAYKFNITSTENEGEYVITSVKGGYVYALNGRLGLTGNADEAFKFTLGADQMPTANEAIAASEVVVAATDGAVVVKGAAGKAVVVTNILGQTLANEVVSSDNATIAVPAGIVVVAVEGEEAVKVVVK